MISDTDVCKHCHRVVGEVPKYHCTKSPTGMHEAETPDAVQTQTTPETCECCGKPLSECEQEKADIWDHNHATGETIDITPVGLQTPEGIQRSNKAMKAFEDSTAAVANAAVQFFNEHRALILESLTLAIQARHGSPDEHAALREDLHQLDALIGAHHRAQDALTRAVAGAPPQ